MKRAGMTNESGKTLLRAALSIAAVAVVVVGALAVGIGTALAHHTQVQESADCQGWSFKGEYIGGSADRKAVADVWVDGEHIVQTFYFDNDAGHLGRQTYYLLLSPVPRL